MRIHLKKNILQTVYWDYALFFSVFFLVFVIPFFPERHQSVLYDFVITVIYLFAALGIGKNKSFILPFALLVMVLEGLSSWLGLEIINAISRSFSVIFFMLIVLYFIIEVAKAKMVNAKVILDAINGYLLLSIVFGILIAIIMRIDPNAFNFTAEAHIAGSQDQFGNYLYYSLVSISTLGYGDIVPKADYAKSLATLISVTGQFYIAILVALLVGKYAANQVKDK